MHKFHSQPSKISLSTCNHRLRLSLLGLSKQLALVPGYFEREFDIVYASMAVGGVSVPVKIHSSLPLDSVKETVAEIPGGEVKFFNDAAGDDTFAGVEQVLAVELGLYHRNFV